MILKYLTLFILLVVMSPAFAQLSNTKIEQITAEVEQLYLQDKESLDYDRVVSLATSIVQNRKLYTKEIIAKAYVLLSEVANNKGDSARAFQFAVDGLTYKPLPPEIQLNLETKIAAGYYVKGKHQNVFHFVEKVLALATEVGNVKYQLLALSYRAMANALIGEVVKADQDLAKVHKLMEQYQQYAEHIELLEIMAISYHYVGDYQTAVDMYERILKLRFSLKKTNGIERTYYNLASAYRLSGRLDDAFNAYWEVKKIADTKNWPIKRGYAELGIGEVLLEQQDYQDAYKTLIEAENSFKGQNLNRPYLSVLIALAKASLKTDRKAFGYRILMQAESLAEIADVTKEQIGLFLMLAEKYEEQGDKIKAYENLMHFVKLEQQFYPHEKMLIIRTPTLNRASEENNNLALELAKIYEAHAKFSEKFERQEQLIILLAGTSAVLLIISIVLWLAYRSKHQSYSYLLHERPSDELANSAETKIIYHRAYKKARKYEYPLTVGYIVVKNWSDLVFSFNKKVTNEVNRTIAAIINEHLGEFDLAGQLHDGEYLVIYPHQSIELANKNFDKLKEALKVRFFANLGEFAINIECSIDSPCIQDIDPYIFLSRLSDVSPINDERRSS